MLSKIVSFRTFAKFFREFAHKFEVNSLINLSNCIQLILSHWHCFISFTQVLNQIFGAAKPMLKVRLALPLLHKLPIMMQDCFYFEQHKVMVMLTEYKMGCRHKVAHMYLVTCMLLYYIRGCMVCTQSFCRITAVGILHSHRFFKYLKKCLRELPRY